MKSLVVLLFALVLSTTALGHDAPAGRRAAVPPAASAAAPCNLNEASAEQLDALPGIGPALAERIIAHRDEHGPFQAVDELAGVRGIGARTVEKLRPYLYVQ